MQKKAKAGSKAKPKRKQGATPRADQAATPPWLWMIIGVLIGLFVAFLMYLQFQKTGVEKEAEVTAPIDSENKPSAQTEPASVADKVKDVSKKIVEPIKNKFDFYTILPEREVLIDEPLSDDTATRRPNKVVEQGKYVLQTGSFKNYADADRRKANLALMGLSSTIQKVTINDNDVWHRVRLGPYTDLNELNRVRKQLHSKDIDTLLIRIKG
jgi:cell division protein FtsN